MRFLTLAFCVALPLCAQASRDLRGIWQVAATPVTDRAQIPYLPSARATAEQNYAKRTTADPLLACFQPGVPRAALLPEPFQIFQTTDRVVIAYQHVHAYRVIFTDGRPHYDEGIEFYMGDSRGRWEGNTFVADVTNFKPETWIDGNGTFHSSKLHVVERFTRTDANTLRYEASIEDPEVFARAWTIRADLKRHTEPNFQLLEHECERDAQGIYRHPAQFQTRQ